MRQLALMTALYFAPCGGGSNGGSTDSGSTSPGGCGDGKVTDNEACDDGNTTPGDGCSATCQEEPGFKCTTPGQPCVSTPVCGDGIKAGSEQCDDHNLVPFDGCSPTCAVEPVCIGGKCSSLCGDGIKVPDEQCDDGNRQDGDGCSAMCMLEDEAVTGFHCIPDPQPLPPTLSIPILYRDMLYSGTTIPGPGHVDFESFIGGLAHGLVKSTLGADGKPEWNDDNGDGLGSLNGAVNFCWWYHDADCSGPASTNMFAQTVFLDSVGAPTTLTLKQVGESTSNVYQFDAQTFFPIDGLGWNAGANPQASLGLDGANHNFAFTSELHYPFIYDVSKPPTLSFVGDDDVWVFINGQLAIDLGGVHAAAAGSVTLDAALAAQLGLENGKMYSIDMFQAERHTSNSTYRLALGEFVHVATTCTPICGDGKVVGNEVCDDGQGKNDGAPGHCKTDCSGRVVD